MRDEQNRYGEPLDTTLEDALRALPREAEPSPLLEARTVQALRQRGVLRGGRRGLPSGWWAAGVAASLALFASGVVTGQWLGARQTAAVVAQQQASFEEMAAQLERTGGAYVSALSRLAETNGQESPEARDVALQMLHQAANEVVRLAPNDPVAVKILQGFEHAAVQKNASEPRARRRQIVWF